MKSNRCLALALLLPLFLHAQELPTNTVTHTKKAYIDIAVGAHGDYVQLMEISALVTDRQALNTLGAAKIGYSPSLQDAEIIEAATIKADGEKIPVDAGAVLTQDAPAQSGVAMFRDYKFKTIVFPRLEIGDSVYYKAKLTQKVAAFPGHFSFAQLFPPNMIVEDARVKLSAPKDYPLQVKAVDVGGGAPEERGELRTWVWTYKRMQAEPLEPGMASLPHYSPRILISSFRDYRALAAAYQERERSKATITPAIQSLAAELTNGVQDRREQVKRLYDWIAHNIRYVALHVDIGGFMPNDAGKVLANRYGDCKDHVVLLDALLAAKGIQSTPVLIDARPNYTLPEIPVPQAFNHVITYVPELDMYLDSTNPFTPFGVLPMEDAGKPVIHTAAYKGIQGTPPSTTANASITRNTFVYDKDGGLAGKVEIDTSGSIAVVMRGFASAIPAMREPEFMREFLARNGLMSGEGSLSKTDNAGNNLFAIAYSGKHALNTGAAGAFSLKAPFPTPFSVDAMLHVPLPRERRYPYTCSARTLEDHFDVMLPANMKVVGIPANVSAAMGDVTYQSTYRLDGNHLVASRKLVSGVKSNECEPSRYPEQQKMIQAIARDVASQVVYQPR